MISNFDKNENNKNNEEWKEMLFKKFIKFVHLDSYLSVDVTNIINNGIWDEKNEQKDVIWLDQENCYFNYDHLANQCIIKNDKNSINFELSLKNLGKFLTNIRNNLIENFKPNEHCEFFFQNDITVFKNVVVKNLYFKNSIRDNSNARNSIELQLAFLNLFSIFERSLGDILYSACNYNSTKVPFLLKDLINDDIILSIFGESLIDLTKLLVYTPYSLNLRNLCWHGFMNSNQLNEKYLYFLIAIITSMNHLVLNKKFKIKSRKKFNLIECTNSVNQKNLHLVNNFNLNYTKECVDIIQKTLIIDECRKDLWLYSFTECINHDNYDKYDSTVLLLSQLEHILRKLYSLTNNTVKENDYQFKMNTFCQYALTSEYYLTIDDLISFNFTDQTKVTKNKINKLVYLLDDTILMCLYDLLMYIDGPRLRDHISHGDMDQIDNIPDYFINLLKYICIKLASLGVDSKNHKNFFEYSSIINMNYKSNYHPIDILKKDLFDFIKLNSLNAQTSENLSSLINILELNLNKIFKVNLNSAIETKINLIKNEWVLKHFDLIFRYETINSSEVENLKSLKSCEFHLITQLRIIIKESNEVASNLIKKINNDVNVNMRERQRKNLENFNSTLPLLKSILILSELVYILLIDKYIINSKSISFNLYYKNFEVVKQFLKFYLQFIQNLNKCIQSNKWSECKEMILNNKKFNYNSMIKEIL